jgi:hypothetical protein|tara:strand:- start:3032 stop:3376 length:345 start_codon:yes stop_codon:yes gene_type:complete
MANTPFKMKSSPNELFLFGKTKKSKKIKDGYEIKEKTTTRGDVVKTKKSKKLLANELGDTYVVKSKTKSKGGEVIKSKSVVIDKGGNRKTKVTTKKGKTKTVVWDDGKKTVTRN